MVKLPELETQAKEMVRVYKDYSTTVKVSAPDGTGITESLVTDEGMNRLADMFERVSIGNRAAVFGLFIEGLNELGLGANIEQFKGAVH